MPAHPDVKRAQASQRKPRVKWAQGGACARGPCARDTHRFGVAHDDAGNAPATSNAITITPGQPTDIRLTSNPPWVGGNKHATLRAQLFDFYANGIADQPVVFQLLSGSSAPACCPVPGGTCEPLPQP